ncbi:hypothetical protein [Dyella humicola]|uniref:hypothetical protein n=1 Tax=Dyella humicola TaxID=2992126 RepID=UPI0022567DA3|nr:hypothetical protein [Dyella humicola]
MSSLWTDLLVLHGYITDAKLTRRLAQVKRRRDVERDRRKLSPGRRLRAWSARLCLGIGDGKLRTQ